MQKEVKDPNDITKCSYLFEDTAIDLEFVNDVREGQRRLTEKCNHYLPQEPFETDDGYKNRLNRASLRNYLLKAQRLAAATVLRKPIAIEGDTVGFSDWVTSDGQSLQLFAKNLLEAAWLEGFALVLTDSPQIGTVSSLKQQKEAGYRPYWNLIKRSQILEARATLATKTVNGKQVLGQTLSYLKFQSWEATPEHDAEATIMEYQLDEIVQWRQWAVREVQGDLTWVLVDQGEINLAYIPVSALYIEQEGFFKGSIPLLETAYLTLRHFQVASDLYHLLHLSSNPKFYITGVDSNEIDIKQSSNVGLVLESPDAKIGWVTLDSSPVSEHRNVLAELKEDLLSGAVQIFEQKKVAETEASKQIDREQNSSLLALSAQGLEHCLNEALAHASDFLKTDPPKVVVNKKFSLNQVNHQDFSAWLQGWLSNAYTQETFLKKLEASGFFEDVPEYDRERELERTNSLA